MTLPLAPYRLSRERRFRPTRLAASLLATMLALASPAHAVIEAELIGADLVVRPVKVATLRDASMSYFDEQRTLQHAGADQLVQLRAIGGEAGAADVPGPYVELTDGQRYPGEWLGPTPDGSGLRWRNDLVGDLSVSLDQVHRIVWGDASEHGATGTGLDRLTLTNRDALTGFVAALGESGVELIPDGASEPVTIPYERIASVVLANPPKDGAEASHRLTLSDGTRVLGDGLRWVDGLALWRVTPPGGLPLEVRRPIEALTRIEFKAGGYSLVELSRLPMHVGAGHEVFGVVVPVRAEGAQIRAHAPASLSFELPAGAVRLAAVAELDTSDTPAHAEPWADFEVVVLSGGVEAGRVHLTADRPRARINVAVSGGSLTLRLEPGVNGPILDRLRLRDAVLLRRRPPAGSAGP